MSEVEGRSECAEQANRVEARKGWFATRVVVKAVTTALALAFLGIVPESQVPMTFDQSPYDKAQQLVDIGGRNLNLYCTGVGSPTVVLDLGYGDPLLAWGYVQPSASRITRVCSYERAGYGFSDPGPLPRTTSAIVDDLHALLTRARVAPPYVLVGHSFGGLDVRLFADRFSSQVIGMVLVDPAVEGWDEIVNQMFPQNKALDAPFYARLAHCKKLAEEKQLTSPSTCIDAPDPRYTAEVASARVAAKQRPGYWATLASEAESVDGADITELRSEQRNYGAMPLLVLTAVPELAIDEKAKKWRQVHEAVAAESLRGINCDVTGSGHHIQLYKPATVVAAIREVIRLAGSSTAPTCAGLDTP